MGTVQIQANLANLLSYIGSLYRSPAEAAKEYVSNAIDAWKTASKAGETVEPCLVQYSLFKDRIVVDYSSPGMSESEFKVTLKQVAESVKKGQPLIGQLGIGLFAFNQFATSATFLSKKDKGFPTIKVVLRKGNDKAEIETAAKRESLSQPGMVIVFRGLNHNPLKARGPLSADVLQHFFAEKFDPYLREGNLVLKITANGHTSTVEPLKIDLPRIGTMFEQLTLGNQWQKLIRTCLWFDPTGKGKVSIRHTGVVIVDDLKNLSASGLGLEESVFSQGYVKGDIEADFLSPLPARTGFSENDDWLAFLAELHKLCPYVEAEVEERRREWEEKSLTEIQKKAVELAKDILNQEQFRDLAVLGGLSREGKRKTRTGIGGKKGRQTGTRSQQQGAKPSPTGMRITYRELPFEDGPSLHSRFVSGMVQVNQLNPDYQREWKGSEANKLPYCTLMIGKEAIAYNDKTNVANALLEKLLAFHFQVKLKATERPTRQVKPTSKRPRLSTAQMRLKLDRAA